MEERISPTFVTVDVEWATRDQMICQIGLVVVHSNDMIPEHRQWIIQPPDNLYDETLFRNHHIRPEMTATAPTLEELWPEIRPYFLMGEIWAHNAVSAELPAIRKSLSEYRIPCEWLDIRDSMELFKRPDCSGGNTLGQCAMAMGITFDETVHHDALYDASVLSEILLAYRSGVRPSWDVVPRSAEEMRKSLQEKMVLHLGEFAAREKQQSEQKKAGLERDQADLFAELASSYDGAQPQVVDVFDIGDRMQKDGTDLVDIARLDTLEGNPLKGRVVAMTGAFHIPRKEIERAIEAMGGTWDSMTKHTDILLVGNRNVGLPKLAKYEKQKEKRPVALVVGDADLDALLYGDGHKFLSLPPE